MTIALIIGGAIILAWIVRCWIVAGKDLMSDHHCSFCRGCGRFIVTYSDWNDHVDNGCPALREHESV